MIVNIEEPAYNFIFSNSRQGLTISFYFAVSRVSKEWNTDAIVCSVSFRVSQIYRDSTPVSKAVVVSMDDD